MTIHVCDKCGIQDTDTRLYPVVFDLSEYSVVYGKVELELCRDCIMEMLPEDLTEPYTEETE